MFIVQARFITRQTRQGWKRIALCFPCSFFCLPKRKNQIIKNVFCWASPNKDKGTFAINFSGRHRSEIYDAPKTAVKNLAGFALGFQILPAYFGEKDFLFASRILDFFHQYPKGECNINGAGGFPRVAPICHSRTRLRGHRLRRESGGSGLPFFVIPVMRFSPSIFTIAERCHSDRVLPA